MSAATVASATAVDPPPVAGVPEVVAPPPGHPRFPLMDSLRGVAALAVLLAHVSIFSGQAQRHWYGAVPENLTGGVTVFFVLSGFLLYRPFFNSECSAAPRPRARDFARRRLLRIVPAYWVALTVLAIYPGVPGVFSADWWRYYSFVQFYSHHTSVRGLGIAWTLCVEVAFYAVLPLYAAFTWRLTRTFDPRRRVRFQLILLSVLAAASIALRVLDQGVVMQNSLLTHLYWFALGMGLAVLSVQSQVLASKPRLVDRVIARPGLCWLAAAGVYIVMCALLSSAPMHLRFSVSQEFWQHLLSGVVAFLLVLPAVFGQQADGWPRRVLRWRWLAWLGLISYGVYLWHATIALTLVAHGAGAWWKLLIGDLVLAIACAALSYYLIERPILRRKDRRSRPRSAGLKEAPLAAGVRG